MSRLRFALAAAYMALATSAPEAAAAPPIKVALLPVVVHSQERSDYLQSGVGDMLASRLVQAGGIDLVRVVDSRSATTEVDAARNSARALGARYVIFGSFTSFGNGASLDLNCARTDGGTDEGARKIFVQAGELGTIIPKIGDLAERVARFVVEAPAGGDGPPAVSAAPVRATVTRAEVDDLRRRVEALEAAGGAAPRRGEPSR